MSESPSIEAAVAAAGELPAETSAEVATAVEVAPSEPAQEASPMLEDRSDAPEPDPFV